MVHHLLESEARVLVSARTMDRVRTLESEWGLHRILGIATDVGNREQVAGVLTVCLDIIYSYS